MKEKFIKIKSNIDIGALLLTFSLLFITLIGFFSNCFIIEPNSNARSTSFHFFIFPLSLCLSIPLYFLFKYIYKKIDILANAASKKADFSFFNIIDKKCIKRALIILLCWLPYMIVRYPGNLDIDTQWQIAQFFDLCPKTDHHPWFDTLIFGFFWKIGQLLNSNQISILLYSLIQYLITSFVLSFSISYIENINTPKIISKSCFIFCALFPVIPLFAQTMMKDSLFGWVWILFLVFFTESVRTKGNVLKNNKFFCLYVFIIMLLLLTKKTGIYIFIISMVFYLLLIKQNRRNTLYLIVIILLLFTVMWSNIILPILNVDKGESRELFSIPSQQVAVYIKYNEYNISQKDLQILTKVYTNLPEMVKTYNPTRADNTKMHWNENSTFTDKLLFFRWLITKYFEEPELFFYTAIANSYSLFYPDTQNQGLESLIFYYNNIPSATNDNSDLEKTIASFCLGHCTSNDIHELFKSSYRHPAIAELGSIFDKAYLFIIENIPLLFSKVLFTTWLPLFVFCYLIRKHNLIGILCMLPIFISWLTQFAGPIVLPRYMVPYVYHVPMLISFLFINPDIQSKKQP